MPGVGTTHHVKVGDDYFMLRQATYRKRPAQMFGARFTTGDPDYNTLSAWQYWAQTCWVGGTGAEQWRDDAMYDEGAGIDSSHHEVMVLSRDLGPTVRTGWTVDTNVTTRNGLRFLTWKNALYLLNMGPTSPGAAKLYRWRKAENDWLLIYSFGERVRCFAEWRGQIYFGDQGAVNSRMTGSPGAESFITADKPAGETDVPYAAMVYKNRLYVDFGQQIWRQLDTGVWDGSTPFYTDKGINYISNMEIHLGFLYMASQNGKILRTDGNNTFELWTFDAGLSIINMRSFDGRLFILCADHVDSVNNDPFEGGGSVELILYQFSGAAVTELKRWGRVGRWQGGSIMRIIDGNLYFGATDLLGAEGGGFGIGMYDPREDAYHIVATQRDSTTYPEGADNLAWNVSDVFAWDGKLFCAVYGYGVFYTPFTHRDMERLAQTYDTSGAGSGPGSMNGGWYKSSDFDAGTPGLIKLWNAIIVHVDLPHDSTSMYVEISKDGGRNWAPAGGSAATATLTKEAGKIRHRKEIILQDTDAGSDGYYATRLKYRVTLRTTNNQYSPYLRGVVVRYLPVPEPNWVWDMTLVLSDKQELLDGTIELPNNAAKIAALRGAFRTQSLIHFTEPGGVEWASGGKPGVLITSMDELIPHIGSSGDGALEYEVRLSLMEMVDAYEVFDPAP